MAASQEIEQAIRQDVEVLRDKEGRQIGVLTVLYYEGAGYVRLTLLNDTKELRTYDLMAHPILLEGKKRPVKLMFSISLEPGSIMNYSFEGVCLTELDNLEYLEWLLNK